MASPVSRSSYATLYINHLYYGLYYIIEDVNTDFLKSRFGNKSGALYKCQGDLTYLGPNPKLYENLGYEPETVGI
jgi:spore coat protein CotH